MDLLTRMRASRQRDQVSFFHALYIGCPPEAVAQIKSGSFHLKKKIQIKSGFSWRDGSEVRSTDCSSRGPEFKPQKPLSGSQPSLMGSGALF